MTAGELNWGQTTMTNRPVNLRRTMMRDRRIDWERFVTEHPQLTWVVLLVGAPCCLLGAMVGIVGAVMLPLSLLFGWPIA